MENKIFSFCNQKGGVGKTTSVINISALLAKKGYKVLILDMDSQGNATSGLGIEKPSLEFTTYQLFVDNTNPSEIIKKTAFENLDIIPSNTDLSGAELELYGQERREYRLKEHLSRLHENYDFVFIDCPPSLGLVTLNCLTSSSYIIIPLQCEYYALEGLGQLLQTYQMVKNNLNPTLDVGSVLLTMADMRTNLTQQVIQEVREYFKEKVFKTVIPRSVKLSEAPSFGKPAVFYDPYNKGSKGYIEIADEFEQRFAGGEITQSQEQEVKENIRQSDENMNVNQEQPTEISEEQPVEEQAEHKEGVS